MDKNGVVTALSGGTAVITAKAGTAEAAAEVTVKGTPAVKPGGDDTPGGSDGGDSGNGKKPGTDGSSTYRSSRKDVKTGDDSSPLMLLALMTAAGSCIMINIYRRKKSEDNDRKRWFGDEPSFLRKLFQKGFQPGEKFSGKGMTPR